MPCFSLTAEDKPGQLATLAHIFKEHSIDLHGMWTFGLGEGKAWIITIPKDIQHFKEVTLNAGLETADGTCFRISGVDEPGVLTTLLDKVAAHGINIHALDAIAVGGKFGGFIWAEGGEIESLGEILNA